MSEKTKDYWAKRARNLVKGELAHRGLSYEDLAAKLKKIGIEESPDNLRTKINRGTFSAAFLLQVLQAIDCSSINLRLD